jgi:hypothetical protein
VEKSSTLEHEKVNAAFKILRKIDILKQKYSNHIPLNSFNFSEYQEYLTIRDIDTDAYRLRLEMINGKYNKTESLDSQPTTDEAPGI